MENDLKNFIKIFEKLKLKTFLKIASSRCLFKAIPFTTNLTNHKYVMKLS